MKIFKTKSLNSVVFVFLFGLVIEISFPSYVLACTIQAILLPPMPALINVRSGVTDRGSVLGGWSSRGRTEDWLANCSADYTTSTRLSSTQQPLELTVNDGGIEYAVYPTEIDNIGYYVSVGGDGNRVLALEETHTRPGSTRTGNNAWVKFVATGPINPGTYSLSRRHFLTFHFRRISNGTVQGAFDFAMSYSAATVRVTGATCSVRANDRNQQVVLPTVSRSSLQGVGSTAGSKGFTIGVNCPAGVALHATMTDANFPDNRGNFLRLAEDSTAAGVGLQITATDTANVVSYGADSRVAGNTNQWFVGGNATSGATNYIIPFKVSYVQTAANVRPGTVRARSTITFSYQ